MLVIPTRVPGIRQAFGTVSPKACLTESVAIILAPQQFHPLNFSVCGIIPHPSYSRTKTRLILRLLKLDEEIKDFILKIDDTDPSLSFLSVYRLQPLLQVKSKERQRRKFWQMIEEQYPGQPACYKQVALSGLDSCIKRFAIPPLINKLGVYRYYSVAVLKSHIA